MTDLRDRLDEWQRLADEATPGPWSVGDHDHIQGASYCECRSSYGPLVWVGHRDINGTKMLTHIHRRETRTWDDDTSIYSTELPYPQVVALSTSEYVSISPEDAEFIAASRTTMPALLTAVRAVLDLRYDDCPLGSTEAHEAWCDALDAARDAVTDALLQTPGGAS